jgi:hypothetical protein
MVVQNLINPNWNWRSEDFGYLIFANELQYAKTFQKAFISLWVSFQMFLILNSTVTFQPSRKRDLVCSFQKKSSYLDCNFDNPVLIGFLYKLSTIEIFFLKMLRCDTKSILTVRTHFKFVCHTIRTGYKSFSFVQFYHLFQEFS